MRTTKFIKKSFIKDSIAAAIGLSVAAVPTMSAVAQEAEAS